MPPLPLDKPLNQPGHTGEVGTGVSRDGGIPAASRKTSDLLHVLLDRDQSILAFNERVFDWAARADVPLLERLRYLCIVSSNLDEFFEVRVAPHVTAAKTGDTKGIYSPASLESLSAAVHQLVMRQYALYNDVLSPSFAAQGIRIVPHGERSAVQC